jgi:hypothetical protein
MLACGYQCNTNILPPSSGYSHTSTLKMEAIRRSENYFCPEDEAISRSEEYFYPEDRRNTFLRNFSK